MKRKLPSVIIFCLKRTDHPYLTALLEEIRSLGVAVKITEPLHPDNYVVSGDAYIITDCEEGSEAARKNHIGYCALFPGALPEGRFWDAECIIQGFDEVEADFVIKMYERSHNIPWTILETERTIVRELVPEDIDDMYRLYAEPGLSDYLPGLCEDREEELEFEKMYIRSMYGFYGYGIWTILYRENGRFIGRAGLTHREGFEDLEVGYMLSREYQHKGIAAEVMTAIIKYAAEKFGCERLNAFIDRNNRASVSFAERLGFVPSGTAIIEGRELIWYKKNILERIY